MKIELSILKFRSIDLPMKKRVRHGKGKTTRTNAELLSHYTLTDVVSTFCEQSKPIGNGLFIEKTEKHRNETVKGNVNVMSDVTEKQSFVSKKYVNGKLMDFKKGRHIQPKCELRGRTFIPYTENVNTILVSACKMVGKLKEGVHTLKIHVNIVNDEGEEVLRKFQGKQLQSRFVIGKVAINNISERGVWFEKETIDTYKWLQKMLTQFSIENESLLPED
jgi:hypothetical protein